MYHIIINRTISAITGAQSFLMVAEVAVSPSDAFTATGVLGGATVMGILAWIFGSYIPRKDKFIESLIANHNKELKERDKLKNEETAELRSELAAGRSQFLEALKTTADHCEKEIARVHSIYENAAKLSRDSIEWEDERRSSQGSQG